jgi:hypothetical protein
MHRNLAEINARYIGKGMLHGSELLLAPEVAAAYLDDLEDAGIGVLGVNLWHNVGNTIAEDLASMNLSELVGQDNWVQNSIAVARKFVTTTLPPDVAYMLIVTGEDVA